MASQVYEGHTHQKKWLCDTIRSWSIDGCNLYDALLALHVEMIASYDECVRKHLVKLIVESMTDFTMP